MRWAPLLMVLAFVGCGGHRVVNACPGARLDAKQGPLISEATEQNTLLIEIRDRGASCTVDGVPKVEFVDRTGRVLDFVYKDTGDQMIPPAHPRPVTIAAGKPAFVELNKSHCAIHATDTASTVRLTLPSGPTVSLAVQARRSVDWCPAEKHFVTIDVSAVEAAPPPVSLLYIGEHRRAVVDLLGAPTHVGPHCLVWRWAPTADSALDGARVCFRSGRVTLVQPALHL